MASLSWAATIASDFFTEALDTAFSSHTPSPSGTSWTQFDATNPKVIGATDNAMVGEAGTSNIRTAKETTTIGDDDMDVSATTTINNTSTTHSTGVSGRVASTDTGESNAYWARRIGAASGTTYQLDKTVAGVTTTLGTYADAAANTTSQTIKLSIRTGAKTVSVDGTDRISSADDSLTGNNFAGVVGSRDDPRLDDFLSESVASTGAAQVIQLPTWLRDLFQRNPKSAYADDGLAVAYYESSVIGLGTPDDTRRPKDIPKGCKGWVLLYDHGNEMEYKVLADPDVQASMPITCLKTKTSLSSECTFTIATKGEAKIDGR